MRALLAVVLLVAAAGAGCLSEKGSDDPTATPSSTTSRSSSSTASSVPVGTASLVADVQNGTAPLPVNFTVNATGSPLAWRLSFGDGHIGNGTTFPAAVNHTYDIGGNFTANLTVAYTGGNATANVTLSILVPQTPTGPAPPDVTHFEFADSLGCFGDVVGVENCISFAGGPDASGIDGYWQALDERYWGLSFTSTVDQGQPVLADSDCAVTDAAFAVLEELNNGGDPCSGTIPPGTAFLFIYPYGSPGLSMTVDFA